MHDRLRKIIDTQEISVTKFEEKINVATGTIAKCLRNKTAITTTILEKIAENFPDVNIDWLITGRGSMNVPQDVYMETNENNSNANTVGKLGDNSIKIEQHVSNSDNHSLADAVKRFFDAVNKLEYKNEQLYDVRSQLLDANEKILKLTEENERLKRELKENNL